MSLGPIGASFSHYFSPPPHYCIPSCLICRVFRLSFFILSTYFASYSLHPEWWSSSIHYMRDSHIISTIYHTDTDLEILSLRSSSRQREFLLHLRVCLFFIDIIFGVHLFMFRVCVFIYMLKKRKKKEKNKHMCVCAWYSPSLNVYIDIWGQFYRVCLLLRVRMWAF